MSTDTATLHCSHKHYASKALYLLSMLVFGLFSSSTVSAQCSTNYGTNYSDTWLVGVNQPTQRINENGEMEIIPNPNGPASVDVRGYGSYEDPYDSCGHEATVNASLTSPNGNATSASGGGGSYARADVSLPFDDEVGEFVTSHDTTVFCPILFRDTNGGGAISSRHLGVSFEVYEKALDQGTRAIYQRIHPCNVICGIGGTAFVFFGTPFPQFIVIGVPFFRIPGLGFFCENLISSFRESPTRVECGNLGIF